MKKKSASRSAQSLLVKTHFAWELQTFTEKPDSLAHLTNHGLNEEKVVRKQRPNPSLAVQSPIYTLFVCVWEPHTVALQLDS